MTFQKRLSEKDFPKMTFQKQLSKSTFQKTTWAKMLIENIFNWDIDFIKILDSVRNESCWTADINFTCLLVLYQGGKIGSIVLKMTSLNIEIIEL